MGKNGKRKSPKTRLRFAELLGDLRIGDLARKMGVTYTQLYPYKRPGANPTLLALEQIARGLSDLKGTKVSIKDLIDE